MGRMKEEGMEVQQDEERMTYADAIVLAKRALMTEADDARTFAVADKISDAYHRGVIRGINDLGRRIL